MAVIAAFLFFSFSIDPLSVRPGVYKQDNGGEQIATNKSDDVPHAQTSDDRLATYTLWLAIFTGVLSVSTIALFVVTWHAGSRQSEDMANILAVAHAQAKAAADQASVASQQHATLQEQATATLAVADAAAKSADIAERALLDLESPMILIRVTQTGIPNESGGSFGFGHFVFSNHGRTPAIITSYFEVAFNVDKGSIPSPLDFSKETPLPDGIIAPPNGGDSEEFEFNFLGELFRLETNKQDLFWMGFVKYRDIFGNSYVSGFCFVLLSSHRCFILAGDDRYKYRRRYNEQPRNP